MTLTQLAEIARPTLNDRVVLAYPKLDDVTELLEGPGPVTEGQKVVRDRILAGLASVQADLDRLERQTRGGAR